VQTESSNGQRVYHTGDSDATPVGARADADAVAKAFTGKTVILIAER
jgi:hypothetical protein